MTTKKRRKQPSTAQRARRVAERSSSLGDTPPPRRPPATLDSLQVELHKLGGNIDAVLAQRDSLAKLLRDLYTPLAAVEGHISEMADESHAWSDVHLALDSVRRYLDWQVKP